MFDDGGRRGKTWIEDAVCGSDGLICAPNQRLRYRR